MIWEFWKILLLTKFTVNRPFLCAKVYSGSLVLEISKTSNPFVPNAPCLYPMKTTEHLTVFWCFQGVEKGCIKKEWANFCYQQQLSWCFIYFESFRKYLPLCRVTVTEFCGVLQSPHSFIWKVQSTSILESSKENLVLNSSFSLLEVLTPLISGLY